jgi:hypothetical protein
MVDIEWFKQAGALTIAGIFVFGVIVGAVVFDGEYSPSIFGSSVTIGEYSGGPVFELDLHGFGIGLYKVSVTAVDGECFYGMYFVTALAFYDSEYNIIWATTNSVNSQDYLTDSSVEIINDSSCLDPGNVKELIIKMREKPVRASFTSSSAIEYRTF